MPFPRSCVKISHKKMAAEASHIDFMFLAPPYPATGSATVHSGSGEGVGSQG